MALIWTIIPLILFALIGIENSIAKEISAKEECINIDNVEDLTCNENFRPQSMKVFSVVDSTVGIFEDPRTKLTVVDLGSFYGIGGNGTIPDEIKIFRDNNLWKTLYKETGIAPSTSHSEWQIPQTVFFNELPGKYKLVLITENTETLVFEFIVKQITERYDLTSLETGMSDVPAPLKQMENGVSPMNVTCKEGMQLVFKSTNDSPACVKSETVEKLAARNWLILDPLK